MPKIGPRYSEDMSKICWEYARDMPRICRGYTSDILKICQVYVQQIFVVSSIKCHPIMNCLPIPGENSAYLDIPNKGEQTDIHTDKQITVLKSRLSPQFLIWNESKAHFCSKS